MEDPKSASIAIKMSWASRRKTSREEDIAYSLLGLFDINMPLIYGEGQNAFYRLQCELIKSSSDETIFAWCAENYLDLSECTGILAKHPAAFKESNDVVPTSFGKRAPYSMTNNGLAIDLLCHPMPDFAPEESCETYFFTTLHCAHESNLEDSIILRMQNQHDDCATLYVSRRLESVSCIKNGGEELIPARTRSIYVHQSMQRSPIRSGSIARLWGYSPRLVTLTRVAQSHFTFNPRLSGPVDCIEIMDNGSIKVPSKKVEERLKLVFETNDGYAFMLAPYCDDGAFFSDSRSEDYTDCIENIKDRQDILGESTILIGARDNYSKRIDRHAFLWIKSRTCRNEVNDFCISLVIDVTSIDRARILNIKQRRRRRPGG
ncbi:MAG: hypothetical protein L6R41_007261 [Letrouitia leprolyta]|nr:MAG: hypothetical protein L6R41_007261 [Letrouitia leprolyta]